MRYVQMKRFEWGSQRPQQKGSDVFCYYAVQRSNLRSKFLTVQQFSHYKQKRYKCRYYDFTRACCVLKQQTTMVNNSLLKSGLRAAAISRSLLEKKIIKPASSVAFNKENNIVKSRECTSQFCQIATRNYSKRNVHHTNTSASIDEDESGSDSDSDKEDRGTSHFWRRKMRTLHSHLDVNKDGVISYDDFMLLGERFTKLGHLTPEAREEFKKVLEEMWEEQWGQISPYNLICIEKYLEEMHHVLNDESLKKKCHRFLPFLFRAVDKDQNGEISVEEFKLFFECLGLTHDHAVVSFSHIDLNEDGKISLKEFVSLGRDFILTEDERRPSKHFWGPLVH